LSTSKYILIHWGMKAIKEKTNTYLFIYLLLLLLLLFIFFLWSNKDVHA